MERFGCSPYVSTVVAVLVVLVITSIKELWGCDTSIGHDFDFSMSVLVPEAVPMLLSEICEIYNESLKYMGGKGPSVNVYLFRETGLPFSPMDPYPPSLKWAINVDAYCLQSMSTYAHACIPIVHAYSCT